jgi:hypothetical protein
MLIPMVCFMSYMTALRPAENRPSSLCKLSECRNKDSEWFAKGQAYMWLRDTSWLMQRCRRQCSTPGRRRGTPHRARNMINSSMATCDIR